MTNIVISEGTLILSDIVDGVRTYLESVDDPEKSSVVRSTLDLCDEFDVAPEDQQSEIYEEIFAKMNELAPSEVYFGAHPGDGALIGFWWENEDPRLFEVRCTATVAFYYEIRARSAEEAITIALEDKDIVDGCIESSEDLDVHEACEIDPETHRRVKKGALYV